jgi:hypothetical protein
MSEADLDRYTIGNNPAPGAHQVPQQHRETGESTPS